MRLDLDAMARIIAQQVKEEVAKHEKAVPDDLTARLDALEAENKTLRAELVAKDDLDALQSRVDAQSKSLVDLKSDAETDDSIQLLTDAAVKMEQRIRAVELGIEETNTQLDAVAKMEGPAGNSVTVDEVVEAMKDALQDSLEDYIARHIPDPIKGDKGDSVNGEEILEGLKLHVAGLMPEPVDVDAIRFEISKTLPQRDAIEKDIEKLVKTYVEGTMPKALEPTDLQVIEAVKAVYPSIRVDLIKNLTPINHKGIYDPETAYDVGDEVLKNGSSYRLMEPSSDGPPSDAWQMIAQGKAGKQGKPGIAPTAEEVLAKMLADPKVIKLLKGKDGVGVEDMIFAEGKMFVMTMTDGTVKTFDQTEFIELIIKAIGE